MQMTMSGFIPGNSHLIFGYENPGHEHQIDKKLSFCRRLDSNFFPLDFKKFEKNPFYDPKITGKYRHGPDFGPQIRIKIQFM